MSFICTVGAFSLSRSRTFFGNPKSFVFLPLHWIYLQLFASTCLVSRFYEIPYLHLFTSLIESVFLLQFRIKWDEMVLGKNVWENSFGEKYSCVYMYVIGKLMLLNLTVGIRHLVGKFKARFIERYWFYNDYKLSWKKVWKSRFLPGKVLRKREIKALFGQIGIQLFLHFQL